MNEGLHRINVSVEKTDGMEIVVTVQQVIEKMIQEKSETKINPSKKRVWDKLGEPSDVLTVPILVVVDDVEYGLLLQNEPVQIKVRRRLGEAANVVCVVRCCVGTVPM